MADLNCSGNINPLYNSYFSLVFNRGTSQFELLCQRANLPGISVPSLVQPTTLGTTIPVPSMVAAFADLSVQMQHYIYFLDHMVLTGLIHQYL